MLALWVALAAVITLVLLLVVVLVWQTARGRREADRRVPELLTLDPGPAVVADQAVLIAERLVTLESSLSDVRADLGAGAARNLAAVDEAYAAPTLTDELWESLAGVGERLDADLEVAVTALRSARGAWAGLDRQPLDRRADQARGVLAEADLHVGRLQDAQVAWLRYAVLRIRRAVATGDLAATAVAEQALADVRGMESLADLRREVDELLENLDLTTRADRVLHPRLARERVGTSAVRTLVADRPWLSAADLLPATSNAWKV